MVCERKGEKARMEKRRRTRERRPKVDDRECVRVAASSSSKVTLPARATHLWQRQRAD